MNMLIISSLILTFLFVILIAIKGNEIASDPYQLSTHVLDIGKGKAAIGVEVHLYYLNQTDWSYLSKNTTDSNGRIKNILPRKLRADNKGAYRLIFFTEDYFKASNQETFFPQVEVVFKITEERHYHVPITLSNFGYSTYRGT
jgi:5-hydroxyisourate hydrolase